jgi:hypothetical protein
MRARKYPLQPLAKRREEQVTAAMKGLATAVADRAKAEEGRRRADQARAGHESMAERVRNAEQRSLEEGGLRAADLARVHAWEVRVDEERRVIEAQAQRARGLESAAGDRERAAQGEVAARRADADAVAKDRVRWEGNERKVAEKKEEEEMAEAFRRER